MVIPTYKSLPRVCGINGNTMLYHATMQGIDAVAAAMAFAFEGKTVSQDRSAVITGQ